MSTSEPPNDRLNSWKEIAAYFGRDAKTVRRWELQEGMPIHRHGHSQRASVFAYRSELEVWQASRHTPVAHEEDSIVVVGPDAPEPVAARHWRGPHVIAGVTISLLTVVVLAVIAIRIGQPSIPRHVRLGRILASATSQGATPIRIKVGAQPANLAILPDGSELYVALSGENFVFVIDLRSLRVTHKVPVRAGPSRVLAAPRQKRVYVASEQGFLDFIDIETKRVEPVGQLAVIYNMAVTPDGERLYVTSGRDGLHRFSTATFERKTIAAGPCPYAVAASNNGERLYVGSRCGRQGDANGYDSVEVIDLATETVHRVFQGVPLVIGGMAVSPDESQFWIDAADRCFAPRYGYKGCPTAPGGLLYAVRLPDLTVVHTFGTIFRNATLWWSPHGDRVLIEPARGPVEVVDPISFAIRESWNVSPIGSITLDPVRPRAYLASYMTGDVLVLDLTPAECDIAPIGLVHHLSFDGTTDDSTNRMRTESVRSVTFEPGRMGQALRPSGGMLRSLQGESIDFGGKPSTVGLFVRFSDTSGEQWLVASELPDRSRGWGLLKNADGTIMLCTATRRGGMAECAQRGAVITSQSRVPVGTWVHVLWVRNSHNEILLYVDGKLDSRSDVPADARWRNQPGQYFIGGYGEPENSVRGLMDELVFYRRELTVAEIERLAALRPGPCHTK